MPRKPRFYLPDIPAHVIQRGNCRQAVFFDAADYAAYLHWLKEGALRHGCAIHAYVLMTNHVHLLMTPHTPESISRTMQFVGRHYVTYINHTYGKSGTLWEAAISNSIRYVPAWLPDPSNTAGQAMTQTLLAIRTTSLLRTTCIRHWENTFRSDSMPTGSCFAVLLAGNRCMIFEQRYRQAPLWVTIAFGDTSNRHWSARSVRQGADGLTGLSTKGTDPNHRHQSPYPSRANPSHSKERSGHNKS